MEFVTKGAKNVEDFFKAAKEREAKAMAMGEEVHYDWFAAHVMMQCNGPAD